jgi:hypothetical protein
MINQLKSNLVELTEKRFRSALNHKSHNSSKEASPALNESPQLNNSSIEFLLNEKDQRIKLLLDELNDSQNEINKLKRIIKEQDDVILSHNNNLYVKHIKIDIGKNNEIIYNRKIQDGQGSNMYGLEVCKSLDMPLDFLKKAEIFRKEFAKLDKDLIKTKKSNYNKKKFVDTFNSFSVQSKVNRVRQLMEIYRIDGVPTVVIDGQYITSPSIVGSTLRGQSEQALNAATLQVMDALLAKKK